MSFSLNSQGPGGSWCQTNLPQLVQFEARQQTAEGFQVDGGSKEETKKKKTGRVELCVISPTASSRPACDDLIGLLLSARIRALLPPAGAVCQCILPRRRLKTAQVGPCACIWLTEEHFYSTLVAFYRQLGFSLSEIPQYHRLWLFSPCKSSGVLQSSNGNHHLETFRCTFFF